MKTENLPIGESGGTNITLEWFLARMHFGVVLQVRRLIET